MTPWIVPILAQALSLSVGDRTEVRLRVEPEDRIPELETRPYGELRWLRRRSALRLGYTPLMVLSPLDAKKPELYVLHTARVAFDFSQRRTVYQLSQTGSYGRQNFASSALSGMPGLPVGTFPASPGNVPGTQTPGATGTPPTGIPTDGTTGLGTGATTGTGTSTTPVGASTTNGGFLREVVTLAMLRTDFNLTHALTRASSFSFGAGYFVIGGVGSSRRELPLQSGPDLRARYDLRLSAKDALFTSGSGTYSSVSNGSRFLRFTLEQGYARQFTPNILLRLSAGLGYVRERRDGVWSDTLYPTFGSNALVGVSYRTRLAGGQFTASAGVGYSPAITYTPNARRVDVNIDPRFLMIGSLGWDKDRTSLFLNAGATLSLDQSQSGAVSNYTGNAGLWYEIVDSLVFETGVRGLRQTITNGPDISFAYALYAALRYDTTLF